jgi:GNAT superfamily N-acetyltransferase
MHPHEEPAVRDAYKAVHPGWPARPPGYYTAYPTLVLMERGAVIGFTCFALGNYTGLVMVTGQDLGVVPDAQGRGFGRLLHDARVALGKGLGARMFSGITQEANWPMIRLFESCGYHACQPAPAHFWGEDGVVYVGGI